MACIIPCIVNLERERKKKDKKSTVKLSLTSKTKQKTILNENKIK